MVLAPFATAITGGMELFHSTASKIYSTVNFLANGAQATVSFTAISLWITAASSFARE